MKRLYALILLFLLLSATTEALSSNEAVITRDGREVLLKDDGTWEYIKLENKKELERIKAEKKDYIKKLEIRNIKPGRISAFWAPFIIVEIKNHGDRTLEEVEITTYCLDKNGMPIYEQKNSPVYYNPSISDYYNPLRPNYIRKIDISLRDAPSEWIDSTDRIKRIKIKVTDIKFQGEGNNQDNPSSNQINKNEIEKIDK